MKTLVTGGTGFVGQQLVRKLTARGDTVRCLVRKRSNTATLAKIGVELAEGDITLPDSVLGAARGLDVVYHCAAKVGAAGDRSDFYLANVEGTQNVIRACAAAGVARLVHVSTQSVTFDFTDKHYADEATPFPAKYRDPYSETKALAEKEVLDAARKGRVSANAVRPTLVWGPGDMTILPTMAKLAKRGMLVLVNGGRAETATSYVENVCDCLILAADRKETFGEAFFVTDDEPITAREFVEKTADAVGFKNPRMSAPYALAFGVAAIAEKLHALSGSKKDPLMTRYAIALTGLTLTFSCEKAKRMLGYKPAVNIKGGMQRLAAWVKEIGGLKGLIS
jgi:2-alkyl-3-oxoalkanoate reductase